MTVNVCTTNCHLKTDSKFTSRRVFSWIMRNRKFSNPVSILLHYFEKKSKIYFRSAEKDVYCLNHYWRVYAVMVTFCSCTQKHLPATLALATRDPVRTSLQARTIRTNLTPALCGWKFVYYKKDRFLWSTKYNPGDYSLYNCRKMATHLFKQEDCVVFCALRFTSPKSEW
jgi:hypothetical protein